jgi:aspartyl-tRNA synthetase
MLLAGVDSIKEVILFPTLRPEADIRGSTSHVEVVAGTPTINASDSEGETT